MTNLGKVGNTDYCCCCTSSSKQRGFCKGMTTKIIPAAVAFGSLRGKNLMGRYGDGRQHREVAWLNWNQFILENRRHRWQSQTHGKKIYNNSAALLLLLPYIQLGRLPSTSAWMWNVSVVQAFWPEAFPNHWWYDWFVFPVSQVVTAILVLFQICNVFETDSYNWLWNYLRLTEAIWG